MARAGVTLLAAAAFVASPSLAEGASQCELHVWPAAEVSGTRNSVADHVYAGGVYYSPGFIYLGRDDPTKSVQTKLPVADAPLPTGTQVELLRSLPLSQLMGVSTYRVIVHDDPLDSLTLRDIQGRYLDTAAPCYADLIVSDVVFTIDFSAGESLKSFIHFRDFTDRPAPVRHLSTWVQTKLQHKRVGKKADIPGSNAEMSEAFAGNFEKFAGYLKKVVPN